MNGTTVSSGKWALVVAWPILLLGSSAMAAGVQARFDLSSRAGCPFPTDRFTKADASNNTGRRVDLPKPDCLARPDDCLDIDLLDALDGFSLQPRLSIPFTGQVDPDTVDSSSVFLVRLGDALAHGADDEGETEDDSRDDDQRSRRRIVGINRIVWDVATATLHATSDEMLEQHTRYALLVTRGVRDPAGAPVEAASEFRGNEARGARDRALKEYRKALSRAVRRAAKAAGFRTRDVVSASVFTTQSITSVMERIRDSIAAGVPEPADFLIGPSTYPRAAFPVGDVAKAVFNQHTGTLSNGAPQLTPLDMTSIIRLLDLVPGAVETMAFGKYRAPDYLTTSGEFERVGTKTLVPSVQRTNDIYFNLFLPSGARPERGWPVVIVTPGTPSLKNNTPFNVASKLAAHGLATISINHVGYGFGPLGSLEFTLRDSRTVSINAGGRSFDQNGDGAIGVGEGSNAVPASILTFRDQIRQEVVEVMQLIRVIQLGMDVDGDGTPDLDPLRIYQVAHSFGGNVASLTVALVPAVRAASLSSVSGVFIESVPLAPANRAVLGRSLASRVPSLINVGGTQFNENLPLRDVAPLVNTVPGAMEIQEYMDNVAWATMSSAPSAFARHLRAEPLAGVPSKPLLVSFAKGDQLVVNPSESAFIRAGALVDATTYFRNDLVFAANPLVLKSPHGFLIRSDQAPNRPYALQAQEQLAVFFETDGIVTIDPDGTGPFFEVPIEGPLPETLSFIP